MFLWVIMLNHHPLEAIPNISLIEPEIVMFCHSWLFPLWDHEYDILQALPKLASSTFNSKVSLVSSSEYFIENKVLASFNKSIEWLFALELTFLWDSFALFIIIFLIAWVGKTFSSLSFVYLVTSLTVQGKWWVAK